MGDVQINNNYELKRLLPSELAVDDRFDVRPWSKGDAEEEVKIADMAASLDAGGQIDDVIAAQEKPGSAPVVLAGHRRRLAAMRVNEKRSSVGRELLRLRVRILSGMSAAEYLKLAIQSNLHRKDFTAMDMAANIASIKKLYKWDTMGFKGSQLVAEYLNVDTATVTQHERFLKAPKDIQNRLQSREISAKSAFDLLDTKPEKLTEVLEKATQKQVDADTKAGKVVPTSKTTNLPAPKRIENPNISKAIRETEGATDKPIVRSRKEIIEMIESLDGPAYGYPDGAVRKWATAFVKWAAGGIKQDRTIYDKFDVMVEKADKGSKESEPKAEDTKAAGKGKLSRKDKGAKKSKAVAK